MHWLEYKGHPLEQGILEMLGGGDLYWAYGLNQEFRNVADVPADISGHQVFWPVT